MHAAFINIENYSAINRSRHTTYWRRGFANTIITTYEKVEEYNGSEECPQYCARLEHFFIANEITDRDNKPARLQTVCGAKIYKLLKDLVLPQKPKDK